MNINFDPEKILVILEAQNDEDSKKLEEFRKQAAGRVPMGIMSTNGKITTINVKGSN